MSRKRRCKDEYLQTIRCDMYITVSTASKFEELCEAYNLPKGELIEFAINDYFSKSTKIPAYLSRLKELFNEKNTQ